MTKSDIQKVSEEVVDAIKFVRKASIDNNWIDEQWFLDWLDEINTLSIDPDR